MKGKHEKARGDYVPGPGQYNNDSKHLHKNPSWR